MTVWKPTDTAPINQIVDVLFDPSSYDAPEFYCPSGSVTGLWRLCHVYFDGKEWWTSDGLDRIMKYPIMAKVTHWMPLPDYPK